MSDFQIKSIKFENFRCLRDTTLHLEPFTLIVGPNGSGKSTVWKAIERLASSGPPTLFQSNSIRVDDWFADRSFFASSTDTIGLCLEATLLGQKTDLSVVTGGPHGLQIAINGGDAMQMPKELHSALTRARMFNLRSEDLSKGSAIDPGATLTTSGQGLAAVLDRIRDNSREVFGELERAVNYWMPDFDAIQFEVSAKGSKSVMLRSVKHGYSVAANQLSEGQLLSLGLLTIAFLPDPPSLIFLEEPDRGLHPRLMRHLSDVLWGIATGRRGAGAVSPIQVIATTHSPYFLDQFRDHPECIAIAQKRGMDSEFRSLSAIPHIDEIIDGAPLGEVWYTGILGGVPAGT